MPAPELSEIKETILAVRVANASVDSDKYSKSITDLQRGLGEDTTIIGDPLPFYKDHERNENNKNVIPAGYVFEINKNGIKSLIVSYHGTRINNFAEVANDLDMTKQPRNFGGEVVRIHRGFNTEFSSSKSDLDKILAGKVDQNNILPPIIFSGHSLGGAVAQIAALHYSTTTGGAKSDPDQTKVITYGAPRVFSKTAAVLYNKVLGNNSLGIKISNDIVPRMPPKSFGFTHVGRKLSIDGSGHGGTLYIKASANSTEQSILEIRERDSLKNLNAIKPVSVNTYASRVLKISSQAYELAVASAKNISNISFKIASSMRSTFVNKSTKSISAPQTPLAPIITNSKHTER